MDGLDLQKFNARDKHLGMHSVNCLSRANIEARIQSQFVILLKMHHSEYKYIIANNCLETL